MIWFGLKICVGRRWRTTNLFIFVGLIIHFTFIFIHIPLEDGYFYSLYGVCLIGCVTISLHLITIGFQVLYQIGEFITFPVNTNGQFNNNNNNEILLCASVHQKRCSWRSDTTMSAIGSQCNSLRTGVMWSLGFVQVIILAAIFSKRPSRFI